MLVDPSNYAAGSAVTGAIQQASQATGTSFHYLLATAQVESGLNPQAGAPTSSARGLFQFIDTTWLATMKQYGPALGYGNYADAITTDGSGGYFVRDPTMRSEILKLRSDPTANAVMAGAFTKANAAALSERLGRSPSEGELYIAHFLGAGGAARLIQLADDNPNAKAASYFPGAAQANSSIFYNHTTGAARSLAQVRDILTARYDVARSRPSDPAAEAPAHVADASIPIPPNPIPFASNTTASNTTAATAADKIAATPPAPAKHVAVAAPPAAKPAPVAAATTAAAAAAKPVPVAALKPILPVKVVKTTTVAATVPAKPPVPDTAGITDVFAAAAVPTPVRHDGQVFHGLFQDSERTGPVAPVVSALWGVPNATPGADAAPAGANMFDLFKDPVKSS